MYPPPPFTSSTWMETLLRVSLRRRSKSLPDWTFFPSWPERGEVFTKNRMEIVGSSMMIRFRALGNSRLQMVSPMCTFSIPESTTMSPGSALSVSTSFAPA